jgi:uncharacterized protein YukJ
MNCIFCLFCKKFVDNKDCLDCNVRYSIDNNQIKYIMLAHPSNLTNAILLDMINNKTILYYVDLNKSKKKTSKMLELNYLINVTPNTCIYWTNKLLKLIAFS